MSEMRKYKYLIEIDGVYSCCSRRRSGARTIYTAEWGAYEYDIIERGIAGSKNQLKNEHYNPLFKGLGNDHLLTDIEVLTTYLEKVKASPEYLIHLLTL